MYLFSKLLLVVLSPLGASLFGGLLSILLAWFRFRRAAWILGFISITWLSVWSLPVTAYLVCSYLESQHPAVDVERTAPAPVIVVLGGGVSPPHRGECCPDLNAAADRVWHGAKLFLAGKADKVLLSGGGVSAEGGISESAAMRVFMVDLGVPYDAILLEQQSRNTFENAKYSAKILADLGVDQILLVTSALHMTRAKGLFESRGLTVIPSATDYEARYAYLGQRFLPDMSALDGSSRAIKEIIGRLLGR